MNVKVWAFDWKFLSQIKEELSLMNSVDDHKKKIERKKVGATLKQH